MGNGVAAGRRGGETGFTLMEMLVVVGITALIAGLAFPAVERMRRGADFAVATRATELALRTTRAAALSSGRPVRLLVGEDGHSLISGNDAPTALPAGVSVAGPPQGIGFYADGSSNGGTVTLTGAARTLRIVVASGTGAIGIAA